MPSSRVAVFLILLAGCGTGPVPISETDLVDKTFTLAIGESITLGYPIVTLAEVTSDSRCPERAVCVWVGNVQLQVVESPSVGEGPCHLVTFNTTLDPRFSSEGLVPLRLIKVEPAFPPEDPSSYRATFQVVEPGSD